MTPTPVAVPLTSCLSDTSAIVNSIHQREMDVDMLYAWIDTIPLSRPKKNISRDFADGVLLAEVVSHFLPKFVELHNYTSACSVSARKVNWETLNRRVLLKMSMRISDETISQLIDAKPGIIEQVLMEVQTKIDQLLRNGNFRTGRTSYRSKSQHQCQSECASPRSTSNSSRPTTITTTSPVLVRSKRSSFQNISNHAMVKSGAALVQKKVPNQNKIQSPAGFKQGYIAVPANFNYTLPPPATAPLIRQKSKLNLNSSKPEPGTTTGSLVEQVTAMNLDHAQDEKFPAPWDAVEGFLRGKNHTNLSQSPAHYQPSTLIGSTSSRPSSIKSSTSDRLIEEHQPPNQIIYRGHKMVPLQLLDEKEREMKSLEATNRSLTLKIFRLETLVNIKDQRVEDLTHQLQNYRALYDAVANKTFPPGGGKVQNQNQKDGAVNGPASDVGDNISKESSIPTPETAVDVLNQEIADYHAP